jgi:SOS response regulatory protein OraA/RecX
MSDSPCYLAALRILGYRFNSEGELRRKLRSKKFEAGEIDAVIERLHREKWLDDARFAGAFTRSRANRRIGRLRILRELQAVGVSGGEATKAVAENLDPEREREDLIALRDKRMRILARRHGEEFLRTDEGRKKLAAHLVAQGYDAATVWDIVRKG